MNANEVTLLLLLRLAGDRLDPRQAEDVRRQVAVSEAWSLRWRQVDRRWQRLVQADSFSPSARRTSGERVLTGVSRRVSERDLRRAEAIGAYLEEGLDEATARQFEELCWRKPAWLDEVTAAAFDAMDSAVTELPAIDWERLTKRVVNQALADAARFNPPERTASASPAAGREPHPSIRVACRNRWPARVRIWAVTAASLGLALIIVASYLLWNREAGPRAERPSLSEPAAKNFAAASPEKPPAKELESAEIPAEPRFAPIEPVLPNGVEEPDIADSSPQLPDDFGLAEVDWAALFQGAVDLLAPEAVPRPLPPTNNAATNAIHSIAVTWHEIKGILAGRGSHEDSWRGEAAMSAESPPLEFATLPGSWARGQVPALGAITLADNSQCGLWRRGEGKNVHVRLWRGEMALGELAGDGVLEIAAGQAAWRVNVAEQSATLLIAAEETAARLQAVSGSFRIDGSLELKKGDALEWSASGPPRIVKTGERPRWIQSPPAAVRSAAKELPRDLASRLRYSADVVHDLQVEALGLDRGRERERDRSIASRILMTFEPEHYALRMLEADDQTVRHEAFRRLMSTTPRQPGAKGIWLAIARGTRQPEKVRLVIRWIEMANQRSPVDAQTAATLVEWLSDDRAFFRECGNYFLTLGFGNKVDYDAYGPPRERAAAANAWRNAIAEIYRGHPRSDVPQRGR